jgi:hypothetical protein
MNETSKTLAICQGLTRLASDLLDLRPRFYQITIRSSGARYSASESSMPNAA